MIASVDSAAVTRRLGDCGAPRTAGQRQAVENCVPLISARPSLGPARHRREPGLGQRVGAGRRSPPISASPSPIIAAAICASGARSPDAPTEPCAGITGVTPARSMSSISAITVPAHARGAAPEREQLERHHQPHVAAGQRLADAAAMRQDQVALQRGRVLRAIRTLASLPKPVLTP
jgi:hypothetical protein